MKYSMWEILHPKKEEHYDDPKAEAEKRLKNMGFKVVVNDA